MPAEAIGNWGELNIPTQVSICKDTCRQPSVTSDLATASADRRHRVMLPASGEGTRQPFLARDELQTAPPRDLGAWASEFRAASICLSSGFRDLLGL
jgi:hypothetical protein